MQQLPDCSGPEPAKAEDEALVVLHEVAAFGLYLLNMIACTHKHVCAVLVFAMPF
jgi:hypothetical protein